VTSEFALHGNSKEKLVLKGKTQGNFKENLS
jgi:hypothetical protein